MSKWKQRDAIVFECEFRLWRIISTTNHLQGYIFNTNNQKEYPEGEIYTVLNVKLSLYPRSERWGEEHYIAESPIGKLFLLRKSKHYDLSVE